MSTPERELTPPTSDGTVQTSAAHEPPVAPCVLTNPPPPEKYLPCNFKQATNYKDTVLPDDYIPTVKFSDEVYIRSYEYYDEDELALRIAHIRLIKHNEPRNRLLCKQEKASYAMSAAQWEASEAARTVREPVTRGWVPLPLPPHTDYTQIPKFALPAYLPMDLPSDEGFICRKKDRAKQQKQDELATSFASSDSDESEDDAEVHGFFRTDPGPMP